MRPIVGIIANQINDELEAINKLKITYTSTDTVDAVTTAGADPIIIPIGDKTAAKKYASIIDGLVLAGGQDVSPLFYGEEPTPKLGQTLETRDTFEIEITKEILKLQKPIFAICRGMQVVNVALGGTLYQDISYLDKNVIKHWQETHPKYISHSVNVEEDSILYKVLGEKTTINSLHHQAIKELGRNLKASAFSPDGLIEAIESTLSSQYLLGLQWHPEILLQNNHQESKILFKHFVDECKKGL